MQSFKGRAALWRRLGQSYWEAWRELHPVCGIVRSPASGKMVIMREGQVVSELRPACPAEYLLRGVVPPEASFGPDLLKLQVAPAHEHPAGH